MHGYADPNLNAAQNIYVSLMHPIDCIDMHDDFYDSSAAFNENKYIPNKCYKKIDGLMVAAKTCINGVYLNVQRKQGQFCLYVLPHAALPHGLVISWKTTQRAHAGLMTYVPEKHSATDRKSMFSRSAVNPVTKNESGRYSWSVSKTHNLILQTC